jgi:hypothetical protein
MSDPDYPHVILSFVYRGFTIQITRDRFALPPRGDRAEQQDIYTAWANHDCGSAVAVPVAVTSKLAIRKAKRWVDRRILNYT